MIVVYFLAAQIVMALFFYPLLVVGKRADEEMGILFERRFQENGQRELEDKMESQRDVLRKRSAREAHRYILKEWNLRKTVTT